MHLNRHEVELLLSFPLERTSEGADIPVYLQHLDDLKQHNSTLGQYFREVGALKSLVKVNIVVKVWSDPNCLLFRLTPQGRIIREIIEAAHKKAREGHT